MPITNEIKQRLTGGASNADPTLSLGGVISSVNIVDNTDNNVYVDVSGDEGAAGSTKYRCRGVVNTHATLPLIAPKVWIVSNTPSADDTIAIGIGTSTYGTGTEQTVANEDTAPSGVSFSSPSTKATGLVPGAGADLVATQHFYIWERRTVTLGATAVNGNAYTIKVEGDSTA
jgi:hypothetical protein